MFCDKILPADISEKGAKISCVRIRIFHMMESYKYQDDMELTELTAFVLGVRAHELASISNSRHGYSQLILLPPTRRLCLRES